MESMETMAERGAEFRQAADVAPASARPTWTDRLLGSKISTRIIGILVGFFCCALIAIGVTLYISWKLEGVAAAINDAGSLRMRSWHLAHDLARLPEEPEARQQAVAEIEAEIATLERVQGGLQSGDPQRPLFIPRDRGIPEAVDQIGSRWKARVHPLAEKIIDSAEAEREALLVEFQATIAGFVAEVDGVVHSMETSYARSTAILRTSQVLLTVLAVFGTIALIRFFFVAVIRPVHELQRGMQRMEGEDFAARVPVLTSDEFGDLSRGFNRMSEHLQWLYATLEERVETKTRRLEEKNRELGILYDVSRFLHQPATIEEISRGFLARVKETFGATAASVRLFERRSGNLYLTTQDGLDDGFIDREAVIRCGECLCGEAMSGESPVVGRLVDATPRTDRLGYCAQAGFATVFAVPINHNQRAVGLFNLFFNEPTELSAGDHTLLESLGQHLAVAIEHVRLQSREREMAVSEERNLLAQELHDSIAQGLAYLNLQTQMMDGALKSGKLDEANEAVELIRVGVQESYADVRELLQHFRARFDHQDLESGIGAALAKFSSQCTAGVAYTVDGVGPAFDPETETQILYIIQEALSNIRKHANAKHVKVTLWRDRDSLGVTIKDDGIGFDLNATHGAGVGSQIGLHIMRERATRIRAKLNIRSKPGAGVELTLTLKRRGGKIAAA